jgi:Domain of unknown function (DUF4112)
VQSGRDRRMMSRRGVVGSESTPNHVLNLIGHCWTGILLIRNRERLVYTGEFSRDLSRETRRKASTVTNELRDGIDTGVREPIGGVREYRPSTVRGPDGTSLYHTIERVTDLMDRAIRIPGTQIRFGLDPIIGFIFPEGGDVVGAIVSAWMILASVRYGLPKGVIARMVFNVAVDYLIGSVP